MHGRHSYVYVRLMFFENYWILKYVTNFYSKKWNKMIAPALKSSLNKSVIEKKVQRGVLYGPDLYEGLNTKHPYYYN